MAKRLLLLLSFTIVFGVFLPSCSEETVLPAIPDKSKIKLPPGHPANDWDKKDDSSSDTSDSSNS